MANFSRTVHFKIRNGKEQEFKRTFESNVVPTLRKQAGFEGELVLAQDEHRAMGISLWKDRMAAENYQKETYPKVLETLTPLLDGSPRIELCDVPFTTLGK